MSERKFEFETFTIKNNNNNNNNTLVEYQSFSDIVSSNSDYNKNWFRKSLILLCEICSDRNLFGQTCTSTTLPAELLLEVLLLFY